MRPAIMDFTNNSSRLNQPPRLMADSKFRRKTVTKSTMHLARIFILLGILMAPVWAQTTKNVPPQGSPPKNLTRLPDGHWTANQPLAKNQDFEVYVVKRGDTLWEITGLHLKNPRLWPQIWEINPHILNPHWIYPNDQLLIRKVKVLPTPPEPATKPITPSTGAAGEQSASPAPGPAAGAQAVPADQSPAEPTTEVAEAKTAPSKVNNVISSNDVYCAGFFSSKQIGKEMVIMGGEEGETATYFSDRNIVYVSKGKNWDIKPGDQYFVVRPVWKFTDYGQEFKDAESRTKYGYFYKDLGRLRILLVNEHSSIAEIVTSCEEIEVGDLLIPFAPRTIPTLTSFPPLDRLAPYNDKSKGKIILTKDCQNGVGRGNIVYIDMGKKKNVAVGDIFRIFRRFNEKNISTFNRPQYSENKKSFKEVRKVLGELLVLRSEDNTATAIVISSREEIHVGDEIEQE
jgi:hypothetical protein